MRLPLAAALAAAVAIGTPATADAYVAYPTQATYVGWNTHGLPVSLHYHTPSVTKVAVNGTHILTSAHVFEGAFSAHENGFHVWGHWRDLTHLHGGYSWDANGEHHIVHFDLVPYQQAYTPPMW